MARYPKAVWKPVDRYKPGGSSHQPMHRPRRLCLHTAVSNGASLFGLFNTPGNAVAHFYVRENGVVEQYVDTNTRASANLDGNHDTISVETWDGYPHGWSNGSDVPKWTPAQLDALADLAKWVHKVHGIPLHKCPSSKPGTKGISYHRQGVDPWRVPGGEYWSKSYGKVCPGDRRVAQIDDIIRKAKQQKDWFDMATKQELKEAIREVVREEVGKAVWGHQLAYWPKADKGDPKKMSAGQSLNQARGYSEMAAEKKCSPPPAEDK